MFDCFQGSLAFDKQRSIVNSFSYLGFQGPIDLRDAEQTFTIFMEYDYIKQDSARLKRLYFGRWIADSERHVLDKYTLKKRSYINTTSMDSELALLTANITLARPGTLFYDPFVGTGSFSIACAHFGAHTWGSDIDGRMIRGKDGKDILTNFNQYSLSSHHLDNFISDLTHSPFRLQGSSGSGRFLDGLICDPPYGVREGLKVLGFRNSNGVASEGQDQQERKKEPAIINGTPAHLLEGYLPPKRPYSLEAILDDTLSFAARTLVDNGRCSLWMPTANREDKEMEVPYHPALELVSHCTQNFNKWSRRLLTYRRIPGLDAEAVEEVATGKSRQGRTANELNSFRKMYFQGFRDVEPADEAG